MTGKHHMTELSCDICGRKEPEINPEAKNVQLDRKTYYGGYMSKTKDVEVYLCKTGCAVEFDKRVVEAIRNVLIEMRQDPEKKWLV